ncbi:MAG: hypothetical protein Kow0037_20260 [Calditrichia bacterium]
MRYALVILLTLLLLGLGFAEDAVVQYPDAWGNPGMSLMRQGVDGVEVNFSIDKFYLQGLTLDGKEMVEVHLPGVFLPNETGAPNLPSVSRYIAIPQGAKAIVNVVASRKEVLDNLEIAPAPRIPLETEDGPLEYSKNMSIYSQNAFYPGNVVQLSEPTQIRGVDVVMLGIYPFQYNPVTRELEVYRDLRVEVTFSGGNGHFGEDRLRSRWWDPILEDALLNAGSLPEVDYNRHTNSRSQDFEYVIIVPDNPDYLAWADSIKQFRTEQGIRTGIVTLTEIGGNSTTAIENWINNAYNTWNIPPAAILFMADYGTGPATGNGIVSPVYNNYCISDHLYADVNGNNMADIVTARMTAQNAQHLETMVKKFLDYERQPPTNPDFYNHPITAMGWQTERWFQICSESINGFFEFALNKQPVRENAIYSGSTNVWSTATNTNMVLDYFGPNGVGYIPATPSHLNDWGGNASRVNNDINSGAFLLQHRDHGMETGWGEPDYDNNDIDGLSNAGLPTFVFSINCLTGKFNIGGECFAEKFHRYQNGGALGIIAATEVSYSFVNDTYVWGMYDNMWPQFMPTYGTTPDSRGQLPAFGNIAGKYFLQQSNWPYNTSNKEVTYYLFHHHGDAFSVLYSEVPQNLTVQHSAILYAGQTSFSVTADQDAFIALTVNGEIIGTGVGTGAPVNITIPPQTPGNEMLVTVTKQNHYRYQQKVMITAATGPYLYVLNPVVDDQNLNGNGIPECGETITMQLNLTNLGVEAANNITGTISCNDTLINIINGLTTITSINASDTVVAGSFTMEISPNTPHMHNCLFDLHLEADSAGIPGGYTWDQTIALKIREGSKIELGQTQLDFPNTFLNFTSTLTMPVSNNGPDTLFVSEITSDIPQFAPVQSYLVIPPGDHFDLEVGFTPDTTNLYNGVITLKNNDPVHFNTTFAVSGTGIFAPDVTLPDSIPMLMPPTDSSTISVTIRNDGPGELNFNAQIAGWDNGSELSLRGAGGSDTYGHMWIDSDENNGPTFDWIDISSTGTDIGITGNNAISNKLNLSFPFNFYGNDYNQLRVCTNGWLSFTTFSVAYNNFALPSNLAPRALIAPLWDDLLFQNDSKAYFQDLGNKAVIMFENVYRVTGEGPMTFEVILYNNNNIVFQYLQLGNIVHDYTVGIQNHLADDGLTIAFNQPYLHDSLAVLISKHTWVQVAPMSGTIAPNSSMDLQLTFITHDFPLGDFWAALQIESNDPDEQVALSPIHMRVVATSIDDEEFVGIKDFELYQNMPNPFNPTTIISYNLPKSGDVELTIFNLLGQKVKTLVNGHQDAKLHRVEWDGTNEVGEKVASGIYIYRLKTAENVAVRKMILMK